MIVLEHDNFEFFQKEFADDSIDLVFTDPPYAKKYFHCYQHLADYCPRIMKPGASLMTIAPHYAIENIICYFKGKLKFRWTNAMFQFSGSHPRMLMGIEVMWKPILWYVKGNYPHGRGFVRDAVEITGTDGQTKKNHKWEQDISWCIYYIRHLTKEGDVVLDPYCGSGTVGVACKLLNRNFIGIDIDASAVEAARKRISEV